jgi:hypothetical protein
MGHGMGASSLYRLLPGTEAEAVAALAAAVSRMQDTVSRAAMTCGDRDK